jgi:glutaredoxin 3
MTSSGVVVYSKVGCSYCVRVKAFLRDKRIPATEVVLDPERPDYGAERDALVARTGHVTFPQVFVGDRFVGGYDDVVRAYDTLALHEMCHRIGIDVPMDF